MSDDVRQALRVLARRPMFALSVALTLAVGIGATTGVYSIYSTVFLKPLPFRHSERIVAVWVRDQAGAVYGVAGGTLTAVRSLPAVERAAITVGTEHTLLGSGDAEVLRGALVSGEFFDVIHVVPAVGRLLQPGDARDASSPVVLSHRLWLRRFGADAGIAGRPVRLGDRVHTVVGVLPSSFHYPEEAEYWLPYEVDAADASQTGRGPFTAIARLRSADVAAASAQAASITLPGLDAASSLTLVPLIESIAGVYRSTLTLLFAAVVLVLLIACFNVANLLLAQSVRRQREFVVRQAMGATRWALVRQLTVESLALAALGAAGGILLSRLVRVSVMAAGTADIPRITEATVDAQALGFTIAAALASACLFGIVPAWLATGRVAQGRSLDRTVTQTRRSGTSSLLIGIQVAGTLTLLVGSALALRSLYRMHAADVGFDTKHLTVASVRPPSWMLKYDPTASFYERLRSRLKEQDGIEAVGTMSHVPLESGLPPTATVSTEEGLIVRGGVTGPRMRIISPGALKALGVRVVQGREFLPTDSAGSTPLAIVNETLARRVWRTDQPIGKLLNVESRGKKRSTRVVGVVGDVRQGVRRDPQAEVYLAATQEPTRLMKVVVRSHLPYDVVARRIRAAVSAEDPTTPIAEMTTTVGLIQRGATHTRFHAIVLGAFGIFGMLLACSGILAVVMYAVSDRTREIGVRIALGAAPGQIVRMFVRELTRPLVGGLVAGLFGVYQLATVLQTHNVLFQVKPFDMWTYLGAVIALSSLALAAAWLPARRAALIEPTVSLRAE